MHGKPLIVFEMANNHMGEVAHGVALIEAFARTASPHRDAFDFGFKLQYRDLDTFVHPAARGRSDVKHIKRFEETRLETAQFRELLAAMRANGFRTVCTPFDEISVGRLLEDGVEVIKIASCSFTDWPLLERIALADRPIIASTASATFEEMDAVVSFFQHRDKDITLLHCVGEYPTPDERLAIGQIELLRRRYPEIRVGFSTHERPDQTDSIMLALAKGASVVEKHVGLPTAKYPINAYSAAPEQVGRWLEAGRRALKALGPEARYTPTSVEREGLLSLKRGVFARRDLPAGKALEASDVYFAFPPVPGQLTANDWSKYLRYTLSVPVARDGAILAAQTGASHLRGRVHEIVESVKDLLVRSNVVVPGKSELEISHHYGLENFARYGLTMITIVNREYCKKLLVMLPGQAHPEQHHQRKEETFVVLHGEMTLKLDGEARSVKRGDVVTVHPKVRHEFRTEAGVVFEEISSTHFTDDSFYTDPAINANAHRKTLLTHWL
jgi:sialic acid synthase SpsE/mannose-6-phosphate isomerase-like protein (cupin superfamily)